MRKKVNKSQMSDCWYEANMPGSFFCMQHSQSWKVYSTKCSSSSMWVVDDDEHINTMCFIFSFRKHILFICCGWILNAQYIYRERAKKLHLIFAWTDFLSTHNQNKHQSVFGMLLLLMLLLLLPKHDSCLSGKKINHINSNVKTLREC